LIREVLKECHLVRVEQHCGQLEAVAIVELKEWDVEVNQNNDRRFESLDIWFIKLF
jgi:hypothetical protein